MRKFCLLTVSLIALAAQAQLNDSAMIKKMADEILTRSEAYNNLRYLTKEIGPRLAGSSGMIKSEKWGFDLLKSTGGDTVWRQACMVPHWIRGGKDEVWVSGTVNGKKTHHEPLASIALGNTIGSGPGGLTAEVIEIKDFDDLEAKKDLVKDKIVFYNYHFKRDFVHTFHAYRDAGAYRSQGPSRAAKYGAKGVMIRSMSDGENNFPHTGGTRYDENYPKIPAVALGLYDANKLSDYLKNNSLTATIKTYGFFKPDTIGHNIIAELKGKEFPNEIITVGAHLDSWDNCEGAHDDGAGCVQTIEVLRAFKAVGYQPKRTIRFVLFANEENGVRGGNKYAEEAKHKKEQHIFALESDAGGFTPRGFGFVAPPETIAKAQQWDVLLKPYGTRIYSGGGGVDIGPLNRTLGVPISGLDPDSQRYFDLHHAENDTFETVNRRELELGAVNMAALIYLVDQYGL